LDDMLIIRGVNVFPTEIEYVLLQVKEIAPHYQVVVDHVGALDTLEVHCEVTEAYFAEVGSLEADHIRSNALRQKVTHMLRSELQISVGLHMHKPGALPRSEGKAVRIVDKRPQS